MEGKPRSILLDFARMQNELNRYFEPFFGSEETLESGSWRPAVDVSEVDDRIIICAEVPGVRLEDIDIRYDDGVLTIRGTRHLEKRENQTYHRVERTYGNFVRSFTLPRTVDPARISANCRDGVLEIEFPKRDESKPRQIRIDVKG